MKTKNTFTAPQPSPRQKPGGGCLERLVGQLLDEARDRKRRVATRLWDLRGDWLNCPVRGPMLPNGRPSPGWLFYQRACANHRRATRELNALLRILPNSVIQPNPAAKERDAEMNRAVKAEADRDHWRTEYKTLELAGNELVKQRDELKAELDKTISQLKTESAHRLECQAIIYELKAALKFVADECDWELCGDGGDDRIGPACRLALDYSNSLNQAPINDHISHMGNEKEKEGKV